MIWIKTTIGGGALRFEPDELRKVNTILQRIPDNDQERTYIELLLKNGEHYLISTGTDCLRAAEMERQFLITFRAAAVSTEPESMIDMDQLMRESGDPPYTSTRLISGKAVDEILALKQYKPRKKARVLRTRYWQLCLDPCDTDVSEAAAPFLFNNEQYDGGAISAKAYELADAAGILPVFFEEDDTDSAPPLRIGRDYYIWIRTGPHTYLLRTGNKKEINERCRQKINDWLAGAEALLELTDSDGDGRVPLLLSPKDTEVMKGYLCYYGVPPILP